MSTNQYQIYINKVMQLAETIVIKSNDSAETINTYVALYHGGSAVDPFDPLTWKYYLNLAGEYHFTDDIMVANSLDTREQIIFSKENLTIHRATARGYAYGTRQYRELVSNYPKQEMLILGILYPVEINKAIAAAEGAILGYPPELVELNEYSLIANLQKWINGYKIRWVNVQYGISDDLYPAVSLGIMYLNLVPAILTARLEACKTNEAHSFHVRQYLGSHGFLDSYIDFLTPKQRLFFYRNIAYIERNSGKTKIFQWLVEHIMTERNLPLGEYVMRHDLLDQPNNLYPALKFHKNPINLEARTPTSVTLSLPEILDKEDIVARDNQRYKPEYLPAIQEQIENSLSNVVLTKTLESSVIDSENSVPYPLEETLINHWLFWSAVDVYTALVNVTHPLTGERLTLTAKEAYVLYWYMFCKSIGISITTIPNFLARHVQRIPLPSVDDILTVVDFSLVPRSVAEQALSLQEEVPQLISTDAFYTQGHLIYQAEQMQRGLISIQEHPVGRAMVENMILFIYSDNVCSLAEDDELYSTWFSARNLDVVAINAEQARTFSLVILKEATGLALVNTLSLRNVQATMIKLLKQLSSYSVQFISEINPVDIQIIEWPAIRFGNLRGTAVAKQYVPIPIAEVLSVGQVSRTRVEWNLSDNGIQALVHIHQVQREELEINTKIHLASVGEIHYLQHQIASVRFEPTIPLEQNDENIIPVLGIDLYLALTTEQRASLKHVFNYNNI